MLEKLILLARLRFNQTRIKHLCVSDEDYVKELIDRPYEALLRANVDIGRTGFHANIFPVTKYYENLSEMCVVGTCVCFYVGDNASIAHRQRDEFSDRIPIRSWRYGIEQKIFGRAVKDVDDFPKYNEGLKKLASFSLDILDYGYEDGKMLYGQYFYELEQKKYSERKKREAEHEARNIARGWTLLISEDFGNALSEFFYIHNSFNVDADGAYEIEPDSIELSSCKIIVERQYILMRCLDDLDKYEGKSLDFTEKRKLLSCDFLSSAFDGTPFEVFTSQLNNIFSSDGDYITGVYDHEDSSKLLLSHGISKQDFSFSLKETWLNWKETFPEDTVISILEVIFNDSKISVKENHSVKFRLSDDGNGLVCVSKGEGGSIEPDLFWTYSKEKGEIDLSDADKLVVEKFIDKYKPPPTPVEESQVDDEIPF